jgi:hypothetical protein
VRLGPQDFEDLAASGSAVFLLIVGNFLLRLVGNCTRAARCNCHGETSSSCGPLRSQEYWERSDRESPRDHDVYPKRHLVHLQNVNKELALAR